MSKNRLTISTKPLEALAEDIDAFGSTYLKEAIDAGLMAVGNEIEAAAHREMKKHRRTGKTESTIVSPRVDWSGGQYAEMDAGFRIRDGGLASIFLMYGTQAHPPHRGLPQDIKLYNVFYGTATRRKHTQMIKAQLQIALNRLKRSHK